MTGAAATRPSVRSAWRSAARSADDSAFVRAYSATSRDSCAQCAAVRTKHAMLTPASTRTTMRRLLLGAGTGCEARRARRRVEKNRTRTGRTTRTLTTRSRYRTFRYHGRSRHKDRSEVSSVTRRFRGLTISSSAASEASPLQRVVRQPRDHAPPLHAPREQQWCPQ